VLLLCHRLWRYETYLRFTHIYEYDARATADIVTISSRAEGWVVEMPALEGTRVEAGQVVARIDDRVAKLKVDGFKARSRASGPSARG
jgi:membrane fusion protein (multidrug efflux system)